MATIKEEYSITGDVPFLDVEVREDNTLFVDPHRIRLSSHPPRHVAAAVHCMDTFLETLLWKVVTYDDSGLALLQRFTEPNETRLGMTEHGVSGRGGADEIGERIWDAINTELRVLVELAIFKRLEDLPLFIAGVDRDRTSDITTRIIYGPLIDFTTQMMNYYPELRRETQSVWRQVWDPHARVWTERQADLPIVHDIPLLLVPTQWADKNLLKSSVRFHQTSLLSWVQGQETMILSDGSISRPRKSDLRRRPGLSHTRETNVRVTLEAHGHGTDLIEKFTKYVEERFDVTNRAA